MRQSWDGCGEEGEIRVRVSGDLICFWIRLLQETASVTFSVISLRENNHGEMPLETIDIPLCNHPFNSKLLS